MAMTISSSTGVVKKLPNAVSFVRIFGALLLPFLMWESWEQTLSVPGLGELTQVPLVWLVVYLVLVLTDKVDGTLARRLHAESGLGATLDVLGDAVLLVVGVSCVFTTFVRDSLSDFEFWFYFFIVAQIVSDKVLVFVITKRRFGIGNALQSIPHKAWAAAAYVAVGLWALTRTMQMWSILALWAVMIYAVIDEIVYLYRAADYNVDFRGHGFEKYALRER